MILQKLWRFLRPEPPRFTQRQLRYGYGIDEFRDDPGNTEMMESFLRSPIGQKVLSVLHQHRPRGYPLRGQSTIESCALEHMRREGHEGCIALLEAMAKGSPKDDGQVPITWGVEDGEGEEQPKE